MADPSPDRQASVPLSDDEWRDLAKRFLRVELTKQSLTYEDLAKRLSALGVDESEASIRNKISRGTFSFVFALQAMRALGVQLIPFKPSATFEVQLPPELFR